jgi:hypothetical protein
LVVPHSLFLPVRRTRTQLETPAMIAPIHLISADADTRFRAGVFVLTNIAKVFMHKRYPIAWLCFQRAGSDSDELFRFLTRARAAGLVSLGQFYVLGALQCCWGEEITASATSSLPKPIRFCS